eukprot:m.74957 g.74957  ORF g.74957 m.74957 type:complete len:86 (-) comp12425_c0_seq1:210-467(-)
MNHLWNRNNYVRLSEGTLSVLLVNHFLDMQFLPDAPTQHTSTSPYQYHHARVFHDGVIWRVDCSHVKPESMQARGYTGGYGEQGI